jgi:hypothetical protein
LQGPVPLHFKRNGEDPSLKGGLLCFFEMERISPKGAPIFMFFICEKGKGEGGRVQWLSFLILFFFSINAYICVLYGFESDNECFSFFLPYACGIACQNQYFCFLFVKKGGKVQWRSFLNFFFFFFFCMLLEETQPVYFTNLVIICLQNDVIVQLIIISE